MTRRVGTPRLRAALALPPVAWIQLPKRVRVSTRWQAMRDEDEPDQAHVDAQAADVEVADQEHRPAIPRRRPRSAAGSRWSARGRCRARPAACRASRGTTGCRAGSRRRRSRSRCRARRRSRSGTPGNSDMVPALNSAHITTGAKPKTEPTERSNSPEVISRVMASAIRPSSTVKVSALPTLVSDMNAGLIAVKTTSISTRSTSGPNSGIATKSRTKPGVSGGATCRRGAVAGRSCGCPPPDLKPPPAKDRGRRRRSVSCRP